MPQRTFNFLLTKMTFIKKAYQGESNITTCPERGVRLANAPLRYQRNHGTSHPDAKAGAIQNMEGLEDECLAATKDSNHLAGPEALKLLGLKMKGEIWPVNL